MTTPSTAIAPRGSYNHASVYYISPQTGSASAGDIGILTAPVSGTEYARFDGTASSLKVNTVTNLTAAAMTVGNSTSSQKTVLRAGSSANIEFNPGGAKTLTLLSGGNAAFAGTAFSLLSETSDGSDNAALTLAGGGAGLTSRGAVLSLYGNEHAQTGQAVLLAGGAGLCSIGTSGAGGIEFYGNNSVRAGMSAAGVFSINSLTASRGLYTDGSKNLVSTAARSTWSPAVSGSVVTISPAATINEADYWYEGPYIAFRVSVSFIVTAGSGGTVRIAHPVAGVADSASSHWGCGIIFNASQTFGNWNYDGTYIAVTPLGGVTWTSGSHGIFVQGIYRAS